MKQHGTRQNRTLRCAAASPGTLPRRPAHRRLHRLGECLLLAASASIGLAAFSARAAVGRNFVSDIKNGVKEPINDFKKYIVQPALLGAMIGSSVGAPLATLNAAELPSRPSSSQVRIFTDEEAPLSVQSSENASTQDTYTFDVPETMGEINTLEDSESGTLNDLVIIPEMDGKNPGGTGRFGGSPNKFLDFGLRRVTIGGDRILTSEEINSDSTVTTFTWGDEEGDATPRQSTLKSTAVRFENPDNKSSYLEPYNVEVMFTDELGVKHYGSTEGLVLLRTPEALGGSRSLEDFAGVTLDHIIDVYPERDAIYNTLKNDIPTTGTVLLYCIGRDFQETVDGPRTFSTPREDPIYVYMPNMLSQHPTADNLNLTAEELNNRSKITLGHDFIIGGPVYFVDPDFKAADAPVTLFFSGRQGGVIGGVKYPDVLYKVMLRDTSESFEFRDIYAAIPNGGYAFELMNWFNHTLDARLNIENVFGTTAVLPIGEGGALNFSNDAGTSAPLIYTKSDLGDATLILLGLKLKGSAYLFQDDSGLSSEPLYSQTVTSDLANNYWLSDASTPGIFLQSKFCDFGTGKGMQGILDSIRIAGLETQTAEPLLPSGAAAASGGEEWDADNVYVGQKGNFLVEGRGVLLAPEPPPPTPAPGDFRIVYFGPGQVDAVAGGWQLTGGGDSDILKIFNISGEEQPAFFLKSDGGFNAVVLNGLRGPNGVIEGVEISDVEVEKSLLRYIQRRGQSRSITARGPIQVVSVLRDSGDTVADDPSRSLSVDSKYAYPPTYLNTRMRILTNQPFGSVRHNGTLHAVSKKVNREDAHVNGSESSPVEMAGLNVRTYNQGDYFVTVDANGNVLAVSARGDLDVDVFGDEARKILSKGDLTANLNLQSHVRNVRGANVDLAGEVGGNIRGVRSFGELSSDMTAGNVGLFFSRGDMQLQGQYGDLGRAISGGSFVAGTAVEPVLLGNVGLMKGRTGLEVYADGGDFGRLIAGPVYLDVDGRHYDANLSGEVHGTFIGGMREGVQAPADDFLFVVK